MMTAGPDEVRRPGPTQTIELERPDTTSGFPGSGPVDHHHLHLPLQRYAVARYVCDLVATLCGLGGSVCPATGEDSPGDSGGLVSDSHGDHSRRLALKQASHLGPRCQSVFVGTPRHRCGDDNQKPAQVKCWNYGGFSAKSTSSKPVALPLGYAPSTASGAQIRGSIGRAQGTSPAFPEKRNSVGRCRRGSVFSAEYRLRRVSDKATGAD